MFQQWFERVAPAVMVALLVVPAIPGGGGSMAFRLGWIALGVAVGAALLLRGENHKQQDDQRTLAPSPEFPYLSQPKS